MSTMKQTSYDGAASTFTVSTNVSVELPFQFPTRPHNMVPVSKHNLYATGAPVRLINELHGLVILNFLSHEQLISLVARAGKRSAPSATIFHNLTIVF